MKPISTHSLIAWGLGLLASFSPFSQAQASNFRIATYNTSLSPNSQNALIQALSLAPDDAAYNTDPLAIQARQIAEVIQRINPDIILLNEFNYDPTAPTQAATLFQQNYLSVGQNISGNPAANPINFSEFFVRPGSTTDPFNTGIASGFDLDNNGVIVTTPETPGYAGDAWGFGNYPGQYGMVVYSKYNILEDQARTFQNFLWLDMPGNLLTDITGNATDDWYTPEEAALFPLSSKSHWDLPIDVNGETIHVLASHPTPPVFDGEEDRNGRRNFDEIRLWNDYITPGQNSYIYDDNGIFGGIASGSKFIIMGDQNADPNDGDSVPGAINQLLNNPLTNTSKTPSSLGGVEYPDRDFSHTGNPAYDTAAFTGGLRVDYVLPSANLSIIDAQVFWPTPNSPFDSLNSASDHHSAFVDLSTTSVPEPSTILGILALGIGGLFSSKNRKSN
ncbi:PEP-CTERM sorting domain-containing protein [Crocosphaera sp. UHCC 0190]|uniref:PEP-CTERM sorting domain-containing protein n=1 Tax=Crocosphaera sp. UHCC 0190 TaxID=3110246 RepID=UPI002B1EC0AE|nr:PEP-CTERM sorting domain-containing protein [Crocosphaera sp. UHCC 0190]MEA5510538.1 PEP-CTERM sorting domain-containing protein [Crocosphaera sp. UHCC 0190]